MEIIIKNIIKSYENIKAVDDVSFTVKDGEMLALLGPSGCGKTTLLRIIAGLIDHDSGQIFIGNSDVSNWPTQKRDAALVFQNYALFPHLNVEENIAYGLKVRKLSKTECKARVNDILKRVKLSEYKKHQVNQLSGGQQQRVALARALVIKPSVLLFDEPLSNLDEKLRIDMRQEIREIQKEFKITSIYVTHDQEEALAIADRIAIMNLGKLQQIDTPEEIYRHPVNSFSANFIGHANILKSKILSYNSNEIVIDFLGKPILLKSDFKETHSEINCMIRPEEIFFSEDGILVKVNSKINLGNIYRYTVSTETNKELTIDCLNKSRGILPSMGENAKIHFYNDSIHIIKNQ